MGYRHIEAAVQRAAKNYHNGIEGLAQTMGKNPKILANKLNPNAEQSQLSASELAEILELTPGDKTAIDLLAALQGRITVPLGDATPNEGEKLSQAYLRISTAAGQLSQTIASGESADGEWGERISPAERASIEVAAREMVSQAVALLRRVEGEK